MASPSPGLFVPAEGHEVNDMDNNSSSSTTYDVDGPVVEDKEWNVEDLYAERPHPDRPGEMQYLIKWEGFPMAECTWEPAEHLGPGLLEEWEETKKKIAARECQPFDLEIYNAACRVPLEPLESPVQEDIASATTKDNSDHGNQAQEADVTDPGHQASKKTAEKATKQKENRASELGKPKAVANVSQNVNKKKSSQASSLAKSPKEPQRIPAAKRSTSGDKTVGGTVTGYQGTARRPSSSSGPASKRPPTLPPTLSSSLANKFSGKKHTATRTQPKPTPGGVGNVFAGGKQRKKRTNLADVMDDKSKAPKAFNSMHVMNIAKKRGKERNEQVHLDLSQIPTSFLLTKNKNNRPNEDQTTAGSPLAPPGSSAMVESPTLMSPGGVSTAVPTLKSKKSVRFTGAPDIMPEDVPMVDVVDDVTNTLINEQDSTTHSSTGSGSSGPPTAPRKLSLTNYHERSQTQAIQKTAVFGKVGSQSVRVLFSGITRQGQPWLSTFIAQEALNFDTICTSYDFMVHKVNLIGEILSAGAVESAYKETLATLHNVADNLRRGSYGNHLVTEHFSILVYPSGCDGWNGLGVNAETHKSESPLRYIVYRSVADIKLHPPTSVPRAPARLNSIEQGSHCQMLIKHLFGLDFSNCLPQQSKAKDSQVFLLLFPEREMQVCNLVKLWLRSCQPKCRIFSSEIKDSFLKFHETVTAGAAGTVILHEDVSASIRTVPLISLNTGSKRCYTFWSLATGQYDPPKFPSDVYATIEPGALQMTRLFPHGRAFLITPSFALSDPAKLCQFLEWFRSYCKNPRSLIMACADFPNYLKDIILEKEKEHKDMCSTYKDDPRLEALLAGSGLRRTDLDARFKAWKILMDIIKQYGDKEVSDETRKFDWITDFIDPNDEQSLVNWFCWWSTTKCDRYRGFAVLGSGNQRSKAAYRNIEIPAYTAETVGDPDIALAREDEHRRAREAAEGRNEVGQDVSSKLRPANPEHAPGTSSTSTSRPASKFQSDRAIDLRNWIISLYRQLRQPNWARLHAKPVSWLDVPMADRFGDYKFGYDTFKNWLGATPPFVGAFNTWYGIFYTIDKEWDPLVPPETYGRHPWFAVIRPMNPHFPASRYAEMELFIWDLSAKERAQSQGRSSILLDMQRRLVNLAKEEIGVKDKRLHLEQVYISSSMEPEWESSGDPLATTLRVVKGMMMDSKNWLPPFANFLPKRGWIPLERSEWRAGMAAGTSLPPSLPPPLPPPTQHQKHQGIPFPRHPSDDKKIQRSIWHAPRPKAKVGTTKCVNDLYRAAFRARIANTSCQEMQYQYRSTTDWYHDMKNEGRTSSLVWVDAADAILATLPNFQKK
ncbi:hypothetical protein F4818DRAFT_396282 [Hypoxylon cercidicola]|nr:hypothetical protein F4818DRAFT_396282 [Hypoxylon cercidicola]